ncbi:helix-turn-helix domain-containing protein [Nocardia sp. NPDC004722]
MVEVEWTAREVLALRTALNLSRPELARRVKVTRRTVLAWETGGRTPRLDSRRLLNAVLAAASDDVVSRFYWELSSSAPGESEAAHPAAASESAADLLSESANTSASLLTWAEASNVGPLTIEDMRGDLRSATREYLKEPTMPLFARVVTVRDKAVELLGGRQKPRHSAQLYGIAGWAMSVLGWITTDLGGPDTGDKHLRTAWVFAENAEDDMLRAWIRASQHTTHFWRGEYEAAAGYALDGLRYAHEGTAALFLSSAYALDLSLARKKIEASAALDRAVDIGAELAESPRVDTLAGPFTCSPERAGGFWADTCLAQGDPARSLSFATAAVDAYTRTPDHRRNLGSERMVRCQQIKAHVALGNLDVVIDELEQVTATPREHRVGPLVQRVGEIAVMARDAANHSSRDVGQIVESAVAFGREADPGTPPELAD